MCLHTQKTNGPVGVSSLGRCHYQHVVIVEYRTLSDSLEESTNFETSSLIGSRMSFPEAYYIIYACEDFMKNFRFFNNEVVWMRTIEPYPLERLVITPSLDTVGYCSVNEMEESTKEVVTQLYQQCDKTTIIACTGFKFLHQVKPPSSPIYHDMIATQNIEEDYYYSMTSSDSQSIEELPPLSVFDVLETTPVLQGRIISSTSIVVVPTGLQNLTDQFEEQGLKEDGIFKTESNIFSPVSSDGDDIFNDSPTPPTQRLLPNRDRTISASEIGFDDSGQVENTSSQLEDHHTSLPTMPIVSAPPELPPFIIEARSSQEFNSQYHFVVLPKQKARDYNIYDLQNILVNTHSVSHVSCDKHKGRSLLNIVIPLNNNLGRRKEGQVDWPESNKIRKHLAIVRIYETEEELETFVPRLRLGHCYTCNDLEAAYFHPDLFFNLFPETLSLQPRRYLVEIENMMATPSPSPSPIEFSKEHPPPLSTNKSFVISKRNMMDIKKIAQVFLSMVSIPNSSFPREIKDLIKKYLIESMPDKIVINVGDVFSVSTDYGNLILRVHGIAPDQLENGGIIGEDFVYIGHSHSFLPHFVSSMTPSSYWEELRPAGLETPCHALFQYLMPILIPCVRPISHCTPVLISGPPGVGKSTVIKAIAHQCRLNVLEFNCYEFCNESLRVAEEKLKLAFDSAINHAPCIMILREINVLTKQDILSMGSSNGEEPRIITAFEKFITNITEEIRNSHFPVIIIGVTSQSKDVSPRIQQCFLNEMIIAPPTQEERIRMLKGLSQYHHTSIEVNIQDIARRSAGFVLGDYVTLLSKAKLNAFKDLVKDRYPNRWIESHNMSIHGILIQPHHLDTALDNLHSLHSGDIGAPKIPSVQWKDVGGLETAKKEILETIQLPLLYPELFVGGLRRSGILLYGAPGTGKTLLAKAVATECSLNFLSVKGPELINMYVGQTEENIREIFSRARGAAPCIIFFDELDSLAPNRGRSGDSGGVMDRVVSQLLAELDGLDKKQDVFVIGATNRPDLIDPALLRPGRFDRLVYLDVCDDMQSKLIILKAITRKFNLHDDVNLQSIAEQSPPNLTGADLYALCADAMLASLRKQIHILDSQGKSDAEWKGTLTVSHDDFMSVLTNLKPSVSQEELKQYRNKKFLVGETSK